MIVYENNDVVITIDKVDNSESKVNVNGENLIWISNETSYDFERELSELLDKYRI